MTTNKSADIVHIKYNGMGYEVHDMINGTYTLCLTGGEVENIVQKTMDDFYGKWLNGEYMQESE